MLHEWTASLIIRLHYESETFRTEDVGVMMYALHASMKIVALLCEISPQKYQNHFSLALCAITNHGQAFSPYGSQMILVLDPA